MPRSMLRRFSIAACAVALAAPLGLAACGDTEPGVDEPAREGLALELGGVDYNVFITRQLNADITPDDAYVSEEAPPGQSLYGVFLQACNVSDEPRTTVSEFTVKDNQENVFEPEALPEDNQFAYTPRTLDPKECIPEAGSVAQLGPTAASMLLFQLPLENTENRPLELELTGEDGETLTFELDI
ncbi:MAG: hypothetical protein QOH58_3623 [Thermoleophilaceae bacterium]|jgi:hypothetical protein|nr:hypothetical protein [Thermoleophilaceae bacterium]